tara:strand:- start:53 stop:658 length:606 start_codon:yes stop_codon:yes gene_type:complete
MNSLYQFIIKPLNDRYENTVKVDNVDLIINTTIENHRFVSKKAQIISVPLAFKTSIKEGDEVIVHHNLFRRWYDQKGRERNSASYFKDDMYFCDMSQIYLIKNQHTYETNLDYCLIKPIKKSSKYTLDKEKPLMGVVKYTNKNLLKQNIKVNSLITFTPNSEFEFIVGNERLYCMKSNNIAIKHERKGNEEEYNPSWANSS